MQLIFNSGTEIMAIIVSVLVVIFSLIQFRKSEAERREKMDRNDVLTVFSKGEYERYKKQAAEVLNNTTISFAARSEKRDKTNLYYSTVLTGDRFIREQGISISDVGEI